MELVSLKEIKEAHERIRDHILRTPVIRLQQPRYVVKAESIQAVGSFKLRGALNVMLGMSHEELRRGVVASSTGNHAQAVAYVAQMLGTTAVIVMPKTAPRNKVEATRALGAEVVLVDSIGLAQSAASELEARTGAIRIPPFDDRRIIAAAGTIALEILDDLPGLDSIAVPIGGGGLIAGIGAAAKAIRPSIRVVGVEPANSAAGAKSFSAGRLVVLEGAECQPTIADGLSINCIGRVTWLHIKEFVDETVTVSEAEIARAMLKIAREARLLAEPSGAAAVAGWSSGSATFRTRGVHVAIVSGGNVDPRSLGEITAHTGE